MIYRRGWVPVLNRTELERKLKEQGFENWNKISMFLCLGSTEGWKDYYLDKSRFAYQVVDNTAWRGKRDGNFWQRLNRIWFVPLWFLTIPFQWLFRGKVGFDSTSKLGKLLNKITGLE